MLQHFPFTKEAMLHLLVSQYVEHLITIKNLEDKGFGMPDTANLLEYAASFVDCTDRAKIKRVRKLAEETTDQMLFTSEDEIKSLVHAIISKIR